MFSIILLKCPWNDICVKPHYMHCQPASLWWLNDRIFLRGESIPARGGSMIMTAPGSFMVEHCRSVELPTLLENRLWLQMSFGFGAVLIFSICIFSYKYNIWSCLIYSNCKPEAMMFDFVNFLWFLYDFHSSSWLLHGGSLKLIVMGCEQMLFDVISAASSGEQWAERGPATGWRHSQRITEPDHGGRRCRKQESAGSRQTSQGEEKEHFQETHTDAR